MDSKNNKNKNNRDKKTFITRTRLSRIFHVSYDVVWNIILFFLIIGLVGVFFASGVGAGYFASLVKDEPIPSYTNMEQDIYDYEETSKLYFANNVYLGDIRADIHREIVTLDEISDVLIKAVIATEDENFEEHKGIVPKAIIRAVLQEALNSNVKTGGSTLTQQLIKNQVLTNEVSFERKAKEILLALRLEKFFTKDEILEAYLNIIPYGREASGRNIAGIQTAAKGIFNVDAKDLNLPQAAFLAGLPQSPSAYTPFKSTGGLKEKEGLKPGLDRMKTVLKRMYDNGDITKKEYDKALKYDIKKDFAKKKKSPVETYPFLTYELQDRAKDILVEILAKKDGYSIEDLEKNEELYGEYRILADRDLRRNGYNIHSTIDKKIYDKHQKIAKEYQYYGPDRTLPDGTKESIQVGMMLFENKTGKIISFVGGREFSEENEWNYATSAVRSNGSTMKPLLVYAPAMELGVIQPGSVIADIPLPIYFPGGVKYSPKNYGGGNYGLISAREALAKSHNIPAAKIYSMIINENPAKNYLEKMGFSTLVESKEANDFINPSLSLGGMRKGVTVEENTNAFTTFANNGKFIDGYMIDKITTHDGTVIYEHEADPIDVFSPQTAYLTIDMLRDVVKNGTGTYIKSQLEKSNVDWAGKTGTSNDYKDAWFVATNPNVTMGSWIGYNTPYNIKDSCWGCSLSYSQRNLKIWSQFVNAATEINPELMAPTERFKQPEGIVSRSYCAISGLSPSKLCQEIGLVQSDIYNSKFVPTKVDDSLVGGNFVMVDGKAVAAGPNTPKEFVSDGGYAFNPDFLKRHGYDKLSDLSLLFPRTNLDKWQKIGFSGQKAGSLSDNNSLSAPSSLALSGSKLTWKKAKGNIVGYRVYRSTGSEFKLVGSTADTNFEVGKSDALYIVKSVDYSGKESAASEEFQVGKSAEELEKEEKEREEKEKEKEEKEKQKEEEKNKEKEKDKESNKDKDKENNKDKEKEQDKKSDKDKKPDKENNGDKKEDNNKQEEKPKQD